MVSDITAAERKADEQRGGLLPSTRLQLSFGAHVLVTMFTFWAVAYYGTKMWFNYDELWVGALRVQLLHAAVCIVAEVRVGGDRSKLARACGSRHLSVTTQMLQTLATLFVVGPVTRSKRAC